MPPQPFVAGYLVYLLFIFLPGIGFGELLGIWKKINTLSEKFALAFGLGISIDTLVMLIRTSKIDGLVGINVATVYLTIALGLVALFASLVLNRKFSFISKPTGVDLALLILILIQGGMLLLYFQKYPIFPQYQSADFGNHVGYVLGLISGSITSIPSGLLYFGVHYQLASAYLLVGGEPLITLQRTIAILITLSPLLFFFGAKKIFSDSTRAGLITALIYTISGSIWFNGPLDAGLYPNFFGILAALFVLIAVMMLSSNIKSLGLWIFFVLALINGYMSHYTFVTLLVAILLLPLLQFILSIRAKTSIKKIVVPVLRGSFVPALIAILPVAVPFLVYPSVGKYALFLATSGGGVVTGGTVLSNSLSSFPFWKYLAVGVYDDLEFVVLILLAIFCLYKGVTSRNALTFVPIIWFITLAVAAPSSVSAWRYSYEALIPLTLMAGYSISSLIPISIRDGRASLGTRMKQANRGASPVLLVAIILILLGTIFVGAYGQDVLIDATSNTSISAQSQQNVYSAIYWLKDNTPNNSQYLSVSDWRFTYTSTIMDRYTFYFYESGPNAAISFAKNVSAQYIVVTNLITAKVIDVPSLFPWNNFPATSNSNLTLIYTNPDVRIYQIVRLS